MALSVAVCRAALVALLSRFRALAVRGGKDPKLDISSAPSILNFGQFMYVCQSAHALVPVLPITSKTGGTQASSLPPRKFGSLRSVNPCESAGVILCQSNDIKFIVEISNSKPQLDSKRGRRTEHP